MSVQDAVHGDDFLLHILVQKGKKDENDDEKSDKREEGRKSDKQEKKGSDSGRGKFWKYLPATIRVSSFYTNVTVGGQQIEVRCSYVSACLSPSCKPFVFTPHTVSLLFTAIRSFRACFR
jgi:hypothetical protein